MLTPFVANSPVSSGFLNIPILLNDLRTNQPKQRTMLGFDHHRHIDGNAVARTIVAEAGRIPNRQCLQANDLEGRAEQCLLRRSFRPLLFVPKTFPNPNLSSSIPTQTSKTGLPLPKLGLAQAKIPKCNTKSSVFTISVP